MDRLIDRGVGVTRVLGLTVGWLAIGVLLFGVVQLEPTAAPAPGDLGVTLSLRIAPAWFLLTAALLAWGLVRLRTPARGTADSLDDADIEVATDRRLPPVNRRLPLVSGARTLLVAPEDILVVQAERDYVRIRHSRGETLIRKRMHAIEAELDASAFLRIHRSTIVRVTAVESVHRLDRGRAEVELSDGSRYRVGASFQEVVAARFGLPA